ncbi:2-keto-4-pentenoate hydratase [Komagataeibacter sp. FNDCF1]|uniref:2-keto-4-pentenoate hydratase n=1 Tax=Komagataeibacter sp. FNDCF1 TaxID=2878681 RepID=UPI001E5C0092|nr:fumarylacetoacetate hydrolase family protein [Komagataeibacter sp. FNDCF1]MCE2563260.1 fumarylacetoacetate hydrolase family protein [Komagataeibacter sp. FNDCF1]
MTVDTTDTAHLARLLDDAARTATPRGQLTALAPGMDLDAAYDVQAALAGLRVARGERISGVKLGFTSRAKMRQMDVSDLIGGRLTSGMEVPDGGVFDMAMFIHPRVEAEIAFILRRPLQGVVSTVEARNAIEAVLPALEIIDSRYQDFRFNVVDVVADNASAAGFVLGAPALADTDFSNLGMVMHRNGQIVQTGSSAAILGHPLRALVAAARLAGERGECLRPGEIVLAGAATAAVPLLPGCHVSVSVQSLGRVGFTTTGERP